MLDILSITGPIYITIVLGFLSVRYGMFSKADMRVFGKFVLNFALPALLFNALAQRRIGEVLNAGYLLAFAMGSMVVLLAGLFWARRRLGKSRSGSAYFAMGMTCSNSGYVGYPVLLLTLGPVAPIVLALNMLVENLLKIPFLLTYAESEPSGSGQRVPVGRVLWSSLRMLGRNPMIIAIAVGTLVSVMGIGLPEVIGRTVGLFSMASGALALFVIGGSLVGLEVRGMRSEVAQIAIGKLVLHPLAVLAAVSLLPWLGLSLDDTFRTAAVLSAAMPMLGVYAILAQRHGHEGLSSAALLATTVASFFTLSALLWALRQWLGWLPAI